LKDQEGAERRPTISTRNKSAGRTTSPKKKNPECRSNVLLNRSPVPDQSCRGLPGTCGKKKNLARSCTPVIKGGVSRVKPQNANDKCRRSLERDLMRSKRREGRKPTAGKKTGRHDAHDANDRVQNVRKGTRRSKKGRRSRSSRQNQHMTRGARRKATGDEFMHRQQKSVARHITEKAAFAWRGDRVRPKG